MTNTAFSIYKDISERTGGNIYLGVVGPVRTGKSTFIRRFTELLVLQNIVDEYEKQRIIDELPQSGSGKSVMTTQPKFVPNEAAKIVLTNESTADGNLELNVRMVDCVGYMIPEAMGQAEGDMPRMVHTPWYDEEIPFEEAAKIGTVKVISDHSTIGVLVTTDGSIADISRNAYIEAEEAVVKKLKEQNKPFVIILNSTSPKSEDTQELRAMLEEKYQTLTVSMDVMNMDTSDITTIIEKILMEFPIRTLEINLPAWMSALGKSHALNSATAEKLEECIPQISKMKDSGVLTEAFSEDDTFYKLKLIRLEPQTGNIEYSLQPKEHVFYAVLSDECGFTIENDAHLIETLKEFVTAKEAYDRLHDALDEVERTGYGLVPPKAEEMSLEQPEIVRSGNKFGVRLKANAGGLHLIKVNMISEIAPMVGSEEQSEELIRSLTEVFDSEPEKLWSTNIFGKSLYDMVCSGMQGKIERLPDEVRMELRNAIERIVNEGCNNLVCLML